jgi:hypothetical protein
MLSIVRPSENFLGMSYSEWVMTWCNWLFSEDPDTYDGGAIVFLRGNLNYQSVNNSEVGPRFIDPKGIYDRTGQNCQTIFERTAVLVPVIVGMFIAGELYEGKRLRTPEQLRYSANIEIHKSGPIWATIMKKGHATAHELVDDLKDYYVATPLFKLTVPENSFLKDKADLPYRPGTYDMVAAGIFLLIKSLPSSTYRINFGGKTGAYHTDSVYDVIVQGKRKETLNDISAKRGIVSRPWK